MERGYLGRLQRWGLGSAGLRWRWRLAMASEVGLERCNLCCQLADVLFCGHAGELAWGLQGLSFLLLSGRVQGQGCTDIQVPVEVQHICEGSLKGNGGLLNAWAEML